MAKRFRCREFFNPYPNVCYFECEAETTEEVVTKAEEHMQAEHHIINIHEEITRAIRDTS